MGSKLRGIGGFNPAKRAEIEQAVKDAGGTPIAGRVPGEVRYDPAEVDEKRLQDSLKRLTERDLFGK